MPLNGILTRASIVGSSFKSVVFGMFLDQRIMVICLVRKGFKSAIGEDQEDRFLEERSFLTFENGI